MINSLKVEIFLWTMQGHGVTYPMRLLEFGSNHIVLSEDWLRKNNAILNYKTLSLSIELNGEMVVFSLIHQNAG